MFSRTTLVQTPGIRSAVDLEVSMSGHRTRVNTREGLHWQRDRTNDRTNDRRTQRHRERRRREHQYHPGTKGLRVQRGNDRDRSFPRAGVLHEHEAALRQVRGGDSEHNGLDVRTLTRDMLAGNCGDRWWVEQSHASGVADAASTTTSRPTHPTLNTGTFKLTRPHHGLATFHSIAAALTSDR